MRALGLALLSVAGGCTALADPNDIRRSDGSIDGSRDTGAGDSSPPIDAGVDGSSGCDGLEVVPIVAGAELADLGVGRIGRLSDHLETFPRAAGRPAQISIAILGDRGFVSAWGGSLGQVLVFDVRDPGGTGTELVDTDVIATLAPRGFVIGVSPGAPPRVGDQLNFFGVVSLAGQAGVFDTGAPRLGVSEMGPPFPRTPMREAWGRAAIGRDDTGSPLFAWIEAATAPSEGTYLRATANGMSYQERMVEASSLPGLQVSASDGPHALVQIDTTARLYDLRVDGGESYSVTTPPGTRAALWGGFMGGELRYSLLVPTDSGVEQRPIDCSGLPGMPCALTDVPRPFPGSHAGSEDLHASGRVAHAYRDRMDGTVRLRSLGTANEIAWEPVEWEGGLDAMDIVDIQVASGGSAPPFSVIVAALLEDDGGDDHLFVGGLRYCP